MSDDGRIRGRVRANMWIRVFNATVEVLDVADSAAFPGEALQLLLRTPGGYTVTTLVPVDFEPHTVPAAQMAHTGPGGRTR